MILNVELNNKISILANINSSDTSTVFPRTKILNQMKVKAAQAADK